jgi:hypothetical protein
VSEYGARSVSAFKRVNAGAHQPVESDLRDLVGDAGSLARQLAEQR